MTVTKAETKEFLKTFQTPTSSSQAFAFGKRSAFSGYRQFTFAEFFANDPDDDPKRVPPRSSIYQAYKKGYQMGKDARKKRDTDREVFVCKTTVHPELTFLTGRLAENRLVPCGWTGGYEGAVRHAEEEDHWIESHVDGDPNRPILREVHSSEGGGVYVQDYRKAS
jgi:hypothetical protein